MAMVLAPLAAVGLLAGCGSSSSKTGSSQNAGGGITDATVGDAATLVQRAETGSLTGPSFGPLTSSQIVPWTASLMPAPAPLVKGKTLKVDVVYGIPTGQVPYDAHILAAIGPKLGWSVKIVQATAQTQQADLTAFQQALLDKPNAIIGIVVPGVWVGEALAQAKAKGIATVNLHQDDTTGPGYDAWVPAAEGIQKSVIAAYAIQQSAGKATSLLFDAPGFSDANIPAAQTFLNTCTGCKTSTTQLNPTDFTDPVKVQSDVTAKLAGSPGLNYLVWPNGSLPIQPVITAIAASSTKTAKLLIDGPAPSGLQLVKSGAIPIAVDSPDALLDLITVDDVDRIINGQAPLAETALRIPINLYTQSNVPTPVNSFADIATAQLATSDWLTPYETAWGVSLKSTILGVAN